MDAVDAVPIVDLCSSSAGSDIVSSLEGASSALLVGHGIDPELRRELIVRTREFFALQEDEKERVRWPGTGAWYGWQPVYRGVPELTGDRVPDLVERFEVQDPANFKLWPKRPAGFRAAWVEYYAAARALASRLVELLANTLDLPGDMLPAWTDRQFANLVANHYPPQPSPPQDGQTRVGPHTDRGGITLLAADEAPGGLEVRLAGRAWVPVEIPDDAYVLQVGDLFSMWTNKRIPANLHRVANPPREVAATASRLSLVYFHYPALDTVVSPAPSCGGLDDPQVAPVSADDHLLRRQEAFKLPYAAAE